MSSHQGLELYSSTYCNTLPSLREGGASMISEITSPVRRLHGPSGSNRGGSVPATGLVTSPISRNWAVAGCAVLWLEMHRPTYNCPGKAMVAVPRAVQVR